MEKPVSPNALLARGRAAFYADDEETAFESLAAALDADPADLRCHYLAALCANLLSREEALEDICRHARETAPRQPLAIACEAVRCLWLANYGRAEGLLQSALRSLPDDLDLVVGLGIVYEYSGETEKGVAAFGRALALDPDNVRAHSSLGGLLSLAGDFDGALAEYCTAKTLDPEVENPHQRLGRDYFYEGMLEPALGEFGRALAEEPDDPTCWFYYLDCLRRVGKTDEAIGVYEEIRQRFGNDPELVSGLYEQFNMPREALTAVERLYETNPDSPDIIVRLARLHRAAGRVNEAVKLVERLVRLAPEDAEALTLLGELSLQSGDVGRAAALTRQAIAIDPDAQNAYVHLADALLFLGRQQESEQAIAELERARRRAWERYQARFSGQDSAPDTQN